MLDNICFTFYTNETNLHLGELCLKHFFLHNKKDNLNVSLISNNFPHTNFKYADKVNYLSGNVGYENNGSHFAQTMLKVLKNIEQKYIFLFCDDYFFIRETKYSALENVLTMMDCDDIDYYGLDDIGAGNNINNYEKYKSNCNVHYIGNAYLRDNNYKHLFSVQACIWKRDSLIKLLEDNPYISLHNLDDTLLSIRENNKLKCICNNLQSGFNYVDIEKNDYHLIAYYEIVRHGVFLIPENGQPLEKDSPQVQFIYKLIEEEELLNKPEFRKQLFYYKNEN